jgi:hypothetical protein
MEYFFGSCFWGEFFGEVKGVKGVLEGSSVASAERKKLKTNVSRRVI